MPGLGLLKPALPPKGAATSCTHTSWNRVLSEKRTDVQFEGSRAPGMHTGPVWISSIHDNTHNPLAIGQRIVASPDQRSTLLYRGGRGVKLRSKSENPIYIKPVLMELAFLLLLS